MTFDRFKEGCKYANLFARSVALTLMIALACGVLFNLYSTTQNTTMATGNIASATEHANNVVARVDAQVTPELLEQYNRVFGELVLRQGVQNRTLMSEAIKIGKSGKQLLDVEATDLFRRAGRAVSGLEAMLDDARPRVNRQLEATTEATEAITNLVLTADTGVATTFAEIKEKMDALDKEFEKVDAVFTKEALEELKKQGADTMFEINGTAKELHGLAGHANSISGSFDRVVQYYEGKLLPKEKRYSNNKFVRALQKTRDVTWTVIRTGAGTALMFFEIVKATR